MKIHLPSPVGKKMTMTRNSLQNAWQTMTQHAQEEQPHLDTGNNTHVELDLG